MVWPWREVKNKKGENTKEKTREREITCRI